MSTAIDGEYIPGPRIIRTDKPFNLAGLEIKTINDDRTVLFCGNILAKFNEITDDYAFTHAIDFSVLFVRKWFEEGMDKLMIDERIEQCKNYAFANLDDSEFLKQDIDNE